MRCRRCWPSGTTATTRVLPHRRSASRCPVGCCGRTAVPAARASLQVSDRADRAVEMALEHMASRDVVFVGHGHFSRAVITRWLELPLSRASASPWSPRRSRCAVSSRRTPARGAGVDRLPASVCAGHVTAEPSFVLAGHDGVVVADGMHTAYPTLADARAALAHGDTPIILGALPFDISRPTALMRPQAVQFTDALPDWPMRPLPTVRIALTLPAPEEHRARIGAALQQLNDPGTVCTRWCWPGRCGWWPTAHWTPAPWCAGWSPPTPPPTRISPT